VAGWLSAAVCVVAKLGIADELVKGHHCRRGCRCGQWARAITNERRAVAQAIRDDSRLKNVQICADVLKHVRIELERDGVTATLCSTGIDTADPRTWKVGGLDLVQVAHDGFAMLQGIPELNEGST
jgi:hypothetical protein